MRKGFAALALALLASRPCTSTALRGPTTFDYETATAHAGGDGGGAFEGHVKDKNVARMHFYYVDHCLIGQIWVVFTDGSSQGFGDTSYQGGMTTVTFDEGDTFSGDVSIYHRKESRHQMRTRDMVTGMWGRIHRKSKGVTEDFALGGCLSDDNKQTISGTDGKVLTGVFGAVGGFFDNLGLLVRDPPRCTVNHVNARWVAKKQIEAPISETWTWGTQYQHSSSNTTEWKNSASASASVGFQFFVFNVSASVSGEWSKDTTQSYGDALTTSMTKTFKVDYGESYLGKLIWQWHFQPYDTCGNSEDAFAQETAITAGAWWPPCCLPNWHTDVQSGSTTCKRAAAMAPGGVNRGCKADDLVTHFDHNGDLSLAVDGNAQLHAPIHLAQKVNPRATNQKWKWETNGWIKNQESGLCLVPSGAAVARASLILYNCNHQPHDYWERRSASQIVHPSSGFCLSVNGPAKDKAPVYLYACEGESKRGSNQYWGIGSAMEQDETNMLVV